MAIPRCLLLQTAMTIYMGIVWHTAMTIHMGMVRPTGMAKHWDNCCKLLKQCHYNGPGIENCYRNTIQLGMVKQTAMAIQWGMVWQTYVARRWSMV